MSLSGKTQRPKNRAIRTLVALAALATTLMPSLAHADVATGARLIGRIDILTPPPPATVTTYYFYTTIGNWGATGCTSNYVAYFNSDFAGAKEALASIMLAKQMAKNVMLIGVCVSGGVYFQVSQVIIDP